MLESDLFNLAYYFNIISRTQSFFVLKTKEIRYTFSNFRRKKFSCKAASFVCCPDFDF